MSTQRKVLSMRTMTITDLNDHIDLALQRLTQCIDAPQYSAWPLSSKNMADADDLLARTRKKAIRRLDAKHSSANQSRKWSWIADVLAAETWRFAIWLRDYRGYTGAESRQQREEMELLFISHLGVEIKRLGFQLDA